MSDLVLGIDLGTTNSVVAVADGTEVRVLTDDGGSRLVPSVVSFHPDGRVLVGVEARERRLVDAPNTVYSVKRLIGRPFRTAEVTEAQRRFAFKLQESANGGVLVAIRNDTFTLTEISAFVLREIKRIAESATGRAVSKAVITVPAAFNELQRSATKAAGRVAGLEVLRIVNEPTAAALAYGIGKTRKERVAVYDLGGGTFDLTLLELENDVFEVLGSSGDSFLGGDDFDVVIAERMADAFLKEHRWDPRTNEQAFERLRAAAEWLKCELSRVPTATATVDELTYGKSGSALGLSFTMTRAEVEALIRPFAERSLEVCDRALREAGIGANDVDAVIMVGGSTRVPMVRSMVRDYFRREPKVDIDPDLVVAQGAAIHGYAITGGAKRDKSLGRVALKRMTVAEVQAVQQKRAAARAQGPKQNAFAPNVQVEVPDPLPAAVPSAPKPQRAAVAIEVAGPAAAARVPGLPKPKARPSTIPPAPTHPIEVPDLRQLGGRISLDDAFGPAKPAVSKGAPPRAAVGKATRKGVAMELDGAFGSAEEIATEAKELDTAVRRASLAPPAIDFSALAPVKPRSEGSGLLTLDELDDPMGEAPAPAAKPAPAPRSVATAPAVSVGATRAVGNVPAPPPRAEPAAARFEPEPTITTSDEIEELDASDIELSNSVAPPASAFLSTVASIANAPKPAPKTGPSPELLPALPPAPPEPELPMDFAPLPTPAPTPAAAPATAVLKMADVPAPILMDVTPLSLGVETVGGFCQAVIRRNVPIPCEQTRSFTTGADRQTTVTIRICQGESRQMAENQLLGAIELGGLRAAARGDVKIAVTFEIDASGILDVKAVDETTGAVQSTRIRLLGGADDAEIEQMRARQKRLVGDGR